MSCMVDLMRWSRSSAPGKALSRSRRASSKSSCVCRTKVLGREVPPAAAASRAAELFEAGWKGPWWSNFLRFAGLVSIVPGRGTSEADCLLSRVSGRRRGQGESRMLSWEGIGKMRREEPRKMAKVSKGVD